MSKRSLVAIILMFCMSLSLLVGCGGDESANGADNSEVSSVVEDVTEDVSDSEVASETGSEENTETVSEEVAEEVDYSAEAVMGLIDELIVKYPDENADYIKALVIAMNLDYMSGEDVDAVMSTYGYTFEQLNENFVTALEAKRDAFELRDAYMVGDVDEYEIRYEDGIMVYECCLNPDEYTYLNQFEDTIAFAKKEDINAPIIKVIENYDGSKTHYVVAMIAIHPDYRAKNIPGFDAYDNVISEYADAL